MSLTRQSIIQFLDDELGIAAADISDQTELLSSGLVDSLAVMDLVAFVSTTGRITVKRSEITLENFNTIPAILRFADAKHKRIA